MGEKTVSSCFSPFALDATASDDLSVFEKKEDAIISFYAR